MVSWMGFGVNFLTLMDCFIFLAIIEAVEEGISLKNSANDPSSATVDLVGFQPEGGNSCKVDFDDAVKDDIEDRDDVVVDFNYAFDEKYDENKDDECVNKDELCQFWANLEPSECETNPNYMLSDCKLACRACEKHKRYSDKPATAGGEDLGERQSFVGDEELSSEEIKKRVAASQKYMKRQIQLGTIDPELLRSCRNTDERCTYWSLLGECKNNAGYMKLSCGPACFSCDMLSIEKRCPMDRETIGPDIWSPGDLDQMFRRLSSEPYKSKYDVKTLSSPDNKDDGPWVLTMENFVNNEEADRLIELGSIEGYERSMDIGEMQPDGTTDSVVSNGRTSWNAWCSNECIEDKFVKAVNTRISNMTKIPILNSEDLQLLRYGPGQLYNTHHDYIEYEIDRQGGVRILTVYLYLNDVEAGGGTNFPDLNLTVMPKRGRVLIWPSVLNHEPNEIDDRTDHQALPVEAGIKYGANAWFHMRNFKGPSDIGC